MIYPHTHTHTNIHTKRNIKSVVSLFLVYGNDVRQFIAVMNIYTFDNDGVIKILNAVHILMQSLNFQYRAFHFLMTKNFNKSHKIYIF